SRTFSHGDGMSLNLERDDGGRVLLPSGPFLMGRIREIRRRVSEGVSQPTLCMPTHAGGWLCPVALVDRVQGYEKARVDIGKYDFIQALLRLAPDGRKEALKACR